MLVRLDLPLSIAERHDPFEEYIQRAHNPGYVGNSRRTTSRDSVTYYLSKRAKLIDCLKDVYFVSVTYDIWNGNAKEDYLSVVIHYANVDWDL